MRKDAEEPEQRTVTTPGLASALGECPEITTLTAQDRLQIECADPVTRAVLTKKLIGAAPS